MVIKNIVFEALYSGRYVCVISKHHPLSQPNMLDFSDLKKEELILLNPADAPQEMKRLIEKVKTECHDAAIQFCNSVFSGYTLVKSGMGIAIMPNFVCLSDQEVEMVPLSGCEELVYGVAWNRQHSCNDVSDFAKIAKAIYAKRAE